MDKSSKIYIAGHRGMVGSQIAKKLMQSGYENLIFRSSSELDLRCQSEVNDFFNLNKPEYVFLAAAKVGGILANDTYKADFIYDNIMIAANVIEASARYGVKKLLNLGSSCIYPKHAPQPMREESLLTGILEPTNEPYAIAKIAAIKLCSSFNYQHGTDFLSLMPTNLYGNNDNYNLETSHVLPALMRKFILAAALEREDFDFIRRDLSLRPISNDQTPVTNAEISEIIRSLEKFGIASDAVTLWGSGEPLREFLHVDDLAEACVYFINKISVREVGEFLNIGSGNEISIKNLAEIMRQITGFRGVIIFDTSKPDGTARKLMDSSRAMSFGWKPTIGLEEGIKSVYEYYSSDYHNTSDSISTLS